MCVIIYIPKDESIETNEIKAAWETNPHGAGFIIRDHNDIIFRKGYMSLNRYKRVVNNLMGEEDLMLHFRITTSKEVNEMQTHPFCLEDIEEKEGGITDLSTAMNGIVQNQKTYKGYNDTMSFIKDNKWLFERVRDRTNYKEWGDIITRRSNAKWCIMTPNRTYLSKQFVEVDGVSYSNLNHFRRMEPEYELNKEDILNERLLYALRKDKKLSEAVNNYIRNKCSHIYCGECTKCLINAKTLRDIKITLNENK